MDVVCKWNKRVTDVETQVAGAGSVAASATRVAAQAQTGAAEAKVAATQAQGLVNSAQARAQAADRKVHNHVATGGAGSEGAQGLRLLKVEDAQTNLRQDVSNIMSPMLKLDGMIDEMGKRMTSQGSLDRTGLITEPLFN